jgi:hypothetical protein
MFTGDEHRPLKRKVTKFERQQINISPPSERFRVDATPETSRMETLKKEVPSVEDELLVFWRQSGSGATTPQLMKTCHQPGLWMMQQGDDPDHNRNHKPSEPARCGSARNGEKDRKLFAWFIECRSSAFFKSLPGQNTKTLLIPPPASASHLKSSSSLTTAASTSTSRMSSSLPSELVRHEQLPRVFIAFSDALSPDCVSWSRPAAPAPASLALSWNKRPFAHFLISAGRAV